MFLIPLPDSKPFIWQVLTQITAMEELGHLGNCRWLFYCQDTPSPQLKALMDQQVAKITVWPDWPRDTVYNGAMKPWLIGKWLSANPDRVFDNYTVIDPDVIPIAPPKVRPFPGVVYGTDTDSYTGPGYLNSKGVLEGLCDIVGVDPNLVHEFKGVGAQLTWTGLSGAWWQEVAKLSIEAYKFMKQHPSDIQAWCSEMYITQLMLIRDGWAPTIDPTMSMLWANGKRSEWNEHGFFHNAGIMKPNDEHFCKLAYASDPPFGKDIRVSPESASSVYVEYVKKTETRFDNIIAIERNGHV